MESRPIWIKQGATDNRIRKLIFPMDAKLPIPTMIVVTASFFNSVNMSQEIQVAAQKSLQDAGNFMRQQVRASVQNGPAPLKFHEGILDGNVHPAAGACAFSVFMWWCCLLRIKKIILR